MLYNCYCSIIIIIFAIIRSLNISYEMLLANDAEW